MAEKKPATTISMTRGALFLLLQSVQAPGYIKEVGTDMITACELAETLDGMVGDLPKRERDLGKDEDAIRALEREPVTIDLAPRQIDVARQAVKARSAGLSLTVHTGSLLRALDLG